MPSILDSNVMLLGKQTPWAVIPLMSLGFAIPSGATDSDTQWWSLVTGTGHFAPRVRWYGEFQSRLSLVDRKSMDRTLLRGAVGYQITPKLSLWGGWGSTPTYHPQFRDETRWYQQALFEDKINGNSVVDRFRFEQRDIQNTGSTALRVRNMARIAHPLDKAGIWQSVAYDELFWNVNSSTNGPRSGFDQNRIFLGANRLVAPRTRLEFGIMRVDLRLPYGTGRHLDCLLTQLSFTF